MVYGKSPKGFEAYNLEKIEKVNTKIDQFVKESPSVRKSSVDNYKLNQLLKVNGNFRLYERVSTSIPDAPKVDVPGNFDNYFVDQIPQEDFEIYKTMINMPCMSEKSIMSRYVMY